MSECVIRMEMPENCGMCPCLDDYGDYPRCRISGEQRGYTFPTREKRMPNCPIICQLPGGHGRLVDVTKIDFVMFTNEDSTFRCGWNNGVRSVMQHAETIVPAERSET